MGDKNGERKWGTKISLNLTSLTYVYEFLQTYIKTYIKTIFHNKNFSILIYTIKFYESMKSLFPANLWQSNFQGESDGETPHRPQKTSENQENEIKFEKSET